MAELLVKLRFTEEAAKSIVGIGLDSGEELDHLDDNMRNSFSKTAASPVPTRMEWSYPRWLRFS